MNFLLDGVIRSQSVISEQATQAQSVTSTGGSGSSIWGTLIYIGIILILFYFFGIRPQKKREKALNALQEELKVGDNVLLDSGIYGKISSIDKDTFIIELGTNKTILVPVLKRRIMAKDDTALSPAPQNKDESK